MPAKSTGIAAPQTDVRAADAGKKVVRKTTKSAAEKPSTTEVSVAASTLKPKKPRNARAVGTSAGQTDLAEAIRAEAYLIWLGEGQPHGRDQDHWIMAEAAVRGRTVASRAPAE